MDFSDIVGQYHAKRALEVALTGGHSTLLYGPSGAGKSMLADAANAIAEIHVNIHDPVSNSSLHPSDFHNTIFAVADIAATNIAEISGLFDICVFVPRVPLKDLYDVIRCTETSDKIAKRVRAALQVQRERNGAADLNTWLDVVAVTKFCKPDEAAKKLLEMAADRYDWSAKTWFRCLRVARTVADLDSARQVGVQHLAEAVCYQFNQCDVDEWFVLFPKTPGVPELLERCCASLDLILNRVMEVCEKNKSVTPIVVKRRV